MTNREQEILEILRQNPLISQNDLADQLGITRSSIGVHITNLMKKGYILGKGYIVREDAYVCASGVRTWIFKVFHPRSSSIRIQM